MPATADMAISSSAGVSRLRGIWSMGRVLSTKPDRAGLRPAASSHRKAAGKPACSVRAYANLGAATGRSKVCKATGADGVVLGRGRLSALTGSRAKKER